MATGKRHQRAPIVNPYEKFSQPEFDNWIGDLTGTLRSALGFEYKPERPQSRLPDTLFADEPAESQHDAELATEVADQLSDSESEEVEELVPKSSKAKGKERDPRERPNHGSWNNYADVTDSDGDQASASSRSGSEEATEESEDGSQDVFRDDEEYDTETYEKEWLQRASSSKAHAYTRSSSRESAEIEYVSQEDDEEGDEADAATVVRSLSQVEDDDEQPLEDDTSFPPPRASSMPSARLAAPRPPDIVDPWEGAEAYAEDYYKGGDRAIVKNHPSSPSRLEEAEEDERRVENAQDAVPEAIPNADPRSPPICDTLPLEPEAAVEDREVDIRDPWNPALAYAEDLYTGGDAPLAHLRDGQDADKIGSADVDMSIPSVDWDGVEDEIAEMVADGRISDQNLYDMDERDRIQTVHVDEDGHLRSDAHHAPENIAKPMASHADNEYTGSDISSRSPSPKLDAQAADTTRPAQESPRSPSPEAAEATQEPPEVNAPQLAENLAPRPESSQPAIAHEPLGAPAAQDSAPNTETLPPVSNIDSVAQAIGNAPYPSLSLDPFVTPSSTQDGVSPLTAQWQALFDSSGEGVNTATMFDTYPDFSVDMQNGDFATNAHAASHNIAELEAELGFHPSSPLATAGPLRKEDMHVFELDDEEDARAGAEADSSSVPPVEDPHQAQDVDAEGEIDLDVADGSAEKPQDDAETAHPVEVEASVSTGKGEAAPDEAAALPSTTEENASPAQEEPTPAQLQDVEDMNLHSALPPASADRPPSPHEGVTLGVIPQLPVFIGEPYPAILSNPNIPAAESESEEDEESATGEDSSFATTDSAEAGEQPLGDQAVLVDDGARILPDEALTAQATPSQHEAEALATSQPDVKDADTVDVEIANEGGEVVAVPEPVEEEPPSIADVVDAREEAAVEDSAAAHHRSKSPTPHSHSHEAAEVDEVVAEESIDGRTDPIDHQDAQTPGDMSTVGAGSQSDSIEQHGASPAKPLSSLPEPDSSTPAAEDLAADAASHGRGPTPEHTEASPRPQAIPSNHEKPLPQKRARSISSTSSLTTSGSESEPPQQRKRAPSRSRQRPSRKVGLRTTGRRAKRAKLEEDSTEEEEEEEEEEARDASPPPAKRSTKGKERAQTPSTASTSGASAAARMLEAPSSRASSVDVAPTKEREPTPPQAAPSPVAAAPIGAAWNMHHQHRKAAPATMFQQIQRRMNGVPLPTPQPAPPKRASSVASSSSAPPSDGSGSSASSASASAPPRRTKSARTLAAAISTTRAVTRANCRYHKISIPREENQQRFYFLVPGCSLGNQEVMEDEEIEDHGIAAYDDGVRGIKDVEQLDLDPYVVGNLRKLTGVDILREGEVYYLPAEGETVRLLRTRPLITARDYGNASAAGSQPSSPLHQHYLGGQWRSPKKPVSGAESLSTVASGGGSILQRGRTATPSVDEDGDEDDYVLTEGESDEEDDNESQRSPTRKSGEGSKGKQLIGDKTKAEGEKGKLAGESSKAKAARRRSRRGLDASYKPGKGELDASSSDEEELKEKKRKPRKSAKGIGKTAMGNGKSAKGSGKSGLKRGRTSEVPGQDAEDGPSKAKRLRKSATHAGTGRSEQTPAP
ncbi:uncharacterized protein SCHCODRAFT_02546695 [Schizophyllum commune H4-8]|uniref:Uncharacterized protein n=1 Tax=Schizophyllum commune (strain H4-8 / FGSC 9210) TaxID=578458 RepID=D8Q9U6_SCHCM|nr:uncharacterized protein SCHCODRAFT_02546695 [Schizophyllum commune H4-8]KAI5890280.1 hypothetical protein SCHCODRAFT_02546695 [Schizophyllum commune H4-8]